MASVHARGSRPAESSGQVHVDAQPLVVATGLEGRNVFVSKTQALMVKVTVFNLNRAKLCQWVYILSFNHTSYS